ncbi:MAG: hypothetical protein J5697_00225, partial [Clostridia bacterium]|nr:hypothetical protein [Clostridia bacterium]
MTKKQLKRHRTLVILGLLITIFAGPIGACSIIFNGIDFESKILTIAIIFLTELVSYAVFSTLLYFLDKELYDEKLEDDNE